MKAARILVTDAEQRAALAAVRSLGRAGHDVWACSPVARPLSAASRFCLGSRRTANPLDSPSEYVEAVAEMAADEGIDVLLPVGEASLLALLPARARLGDVLVPFPAHERFLRLTDKARVLSEAADLGIAVPGQVTLPSADRGASPSVASLRAPLVLKPSRSVAERDGPRRKLSVVHVGDGAGLDDALAALPAEAFPLLVQERIDGPGVGVFLLLRDGKVLARFAHRRIREKPPSGGVSVCRDSVLADPHLVEASQRLLERFGWEGVAMVEYKVDRESGTPYLMEVNPRLWGSLQLAVDAGVDFPALLVASALESAVEPVTSYRVGVRERWFWGEVDHLLARLRGKGADGSGRWAALRDFLSGWGGSTRIEVWQGDDPRPFVRESVQWLRTTARNAPPAS